MKEAKIQPIVSIQERQRIWKEVKVAAGPRYTSDINVELPIKELFEGIARTDRIFESIEELKKELDKSFKSLGYKKTSDYTDKSIQFNLTKIQELGKKFIGSVNLLSKNRTKNFDLKGITKEATKLSKYFSPINKVIWDLERKEDEEQREQAKIEKKEYFGHSQSTALRDLKSLEYSLNQFHRAIRDTDYFSKSFKARLVNDPFLLILGQAGMGKTHLVCDVTKDRDERQLAPTIIVLGEKLVNIHDPLRSIFKACSLKGGSQKILKELNEAGRRKKSRSLIIVDAINEADREGWRTGVRKLVQQIKKYPWVGLVMTCRVPFESLSLPKRFKIITEYHQGFTENELEAMTIFFKFYDIPLPEVPLLISEFSSPLFLSCFCKTAKDIRGGKAKIAQNIRDLALGQVGMTKILEDFYITKEDQLVHKHSSKFKSLIKPSWIWNKSGHNCLIKMVAERMASNGRRYLKSDEIIDLLRQLSNNLYQEATCFKVLDLLIEEGVLIRDAAWDAQTRTYYDVIKFSFHKFSDHIIARYLLDNFFDRNKVKQSLSASTSLGKLFQDRQSVLDNIDLIEALMVEFPERVKKNKKLQDKDLIDFLPKDIKSLRPVREALIESLYWRKPENFLNDKKLIKKSIIEYINKVLLNYEDSSRDLLDLFVSTSTKPFHPFNAKRLSSYISSFSIQNRDLFWSEYLRKQHRSGSVYKLISWIENQSLEKITAEQAWCVITILSWVLTTNVKLLRNRATRCIYILGKIHPEVCFRVALDMLKANDPYITERVLAANYGVVMALHQSQNSTKFKKLLYPFSKKVYAAFFKKRSLYGSTNILIRDYARGIIEATLIHNKKLLTPLQIKRIRPPYKDGGIRRWGRTKDKDDDKYRDGNGPLGWEFEKDTLGYLIPDHNFYDSKDKRYIRLKENIFWRIYNLGYSLEKFGDIDKYIAQDGRHQRQHGNADKVERYGEKYSLIAYREMVGLKMDRKEYGRSWISEDGRGEEVDVDPSFPQSPQKDRLFSEKLSSGPRDIKKWMTQKKAPDIFKYISVKKINGEKGPWILVDGTIGEKDKKNSRKITTHISGLLTKKEHVAKLKEFLNTTTFPGGDNIPILKEVDHVYSGELGWREKKEREIPLTIKIHRGDKQVKLTKKEKYFRSLRISFADGGIVKETEENQEYKIEPIFEKINIQRLSRWFSSKDYSYLGRDDDVVGLYIPSQKIIKSYGLSPEPTSFNFLDSKSKVVSISHNVGDRYGTHENLLYLHKDLVDKIIKKTGKTLSLITWGERQYWPDNLDFTHRKDHDDIHRNHKNVYRKIYLYT